MWWHTVRQEVVDDKRMVIRHRLEHCIIRGVGIRSARWLSGKQPLGLSHKSPLEPTISASINNHAFPLPIMAALACVKKLCIYHQALKKLTFTRPQMNISCTKIIARIIILMSTFLIWVVCTNLSKLSCAR
jgi:hypothetical protein